MLIGGAILVQRNTFSRVQWLEHIQSSGEATDRPTVGCPCPREVKATYPVTALRKCHSRQQDGREKCLHWLDLIFKLLSDSTIHFVRWFFKHYFYYPSPWLSTLAVVWPLTEIDRWRWTNKKRVTWLTTTLKPSSLTTACVALMPQPCYSNPKWFSSPT